MIVNCLAFLSGRLVMLQKPRRGWWVVPGGKVELTETLPEAAAREMFEEAGLTVRNLELTGVHHLRIEEQPGQYQERLIAQFFAKQVEGTLLPYCKEGRLDTISLGDLDALPMDEGDRWMIRHSIHSLNAGDQRVYFGMFTYTSEHELVEWAVTPTSPPTQTTP